MLKGIIDKQEEIPEALKDFYVEKNGRFYLQVEGMDHDENWTGLKTSYQKVLAEKKELESRFKPWKSFEKSPDEIRQALEDYENLKSVNPANLKEDLEKRINAVKQQMIQQHEAEKSQLTKDLEQARTQLRNHLIHAKAAEAINSAEGIAKPLLPLLLNRMDTDDQNRVFIRDDSGNPMVNSKGEYMDPAEFLNALKQDPDYKGLFRAKPSSGSGSTGGPGRNIGGKIQISVSSPTYANDLVKYAKEIREGKAEIVE